MAFWIHLFFTRFKFVWIINFSYFFIILWRVIWFMKWRFFFNFNRRTNRFFFIRIIRQFFWRSNFSDFFKNFFILFFRMFIFFLFWNVVVVLLFSKNISEFAKLWWIHIFKIETRWHSEWILTEFLILIFSILRNSILLMDLFFYKFILEDNKRK